MRNEKLITGTISFGNFFINSFTEGVIYISF